MSQQTKESQTYNTMMGEVEGIITSIQSDNVDLDQLVAKVEKGYQLIGKMRERLDQTKGKVDELRASFEQSSGGDTDGDPQS